MSGGLLKRIGPMAWCAWVMLGVSLGVPERCLAQDGLPTEKLTDESPAVPVPEKKIPVIKRDTPPPAPTPPENPLSFSNERGKVTFSVSGLTQVSSGLGTWWNLSERYAPTSGYRVDRAWSELWLKPGVTTELNVLEQHQLYSGVSYVASGNIGRDVFEQGNRGLFAVEDAYLGWRTPLAGSPTRLDVSYGRQPYKIGSGMLVSVGAMNGFERGATTTFARRAWEEAGLIRVSRDKLQLEGFFLNPNELRSADTRTRLAGSKLEYNLGENQFLGLAYLNVFESEYLYVGAPLQFFPNGREGLNTLHPYLRWNPWKTALPGFYVASDYAYQWNDRIRMNSQAWSGEVGHTFTQRPMTPRVSYAFRSFQGDDPNTADFEKFDPLFCEGAPPLWSSGSNGSFSFLNSNVQAHRIQFGFNLTPTNIISVYYWHLRANEVNSPLQFGQAGRVQVIGGEPELVTGVPNRHLSDDLYFEHLRILSPHWYLTTGLAVSIPGRGLRELVDEPRTWLGGLVNLSFQY